MPAKTQSPQKRTPKKLEPKTSTPKTSTRKKPKRPDPESERRARALRAWSLLVVCGVVVAVGVIPGERAWLMLHRLLWCATGLCLVPLLGIGFFCSSVWLRNRTLSSEWFSLVIQVLFVFVFGATVYLIPRTDAELARASLNELMQALFAPIHAPVRSELYTSGGVFGVVFGGVLAKLGGKLPALVIAFLCLFAFAPMTLPRLRHAFLGAITINHHKKNKNKLKEEIGMEKETETKEGRAEERHSWIELRMESWREPWRKQFRRLVAPLDFLFVDVPPKTALDLGMDPKKEQTEIPENPAGNNQSRELAQAKETQDLEARGIAEEQLGEHQKEQRQKAHAAGEHVRETQEKDLDFGDFGTKTQEKNQTLGDAGMGNTQNLGHYGRTAQGVIQNLGNSEGTAQGDGEEVPVEGDLAGEGYQTPPVSCLDPARTEYSAPGEQEEGMISDKLVHTLKSFGVAVEVVGQSRGPAVTRYELRPAEGVKISKITALSDDIALRLAAVKVRIEAPIPGKPAVGVEIPNKVRAMVALRELIESENYRSGIKKSPLTVALGKDIIGTHVVADLAKLPHLLIAGTTGSGKSVCMNTLILSLLYNAPPEDVQLLMVDPKQVEFNIYRGIPHLLVPVVSDPLKAAGALGWAVTEMERRYGLISEQNVRDLDRYNQIAAQTELEHLARIVIFIDELSDLMMVAPGDVEDSIQRIAQKGRAAGMHLVVATQRPSVDVITGVIKSNLPGRIALSVASQIDSRTIINSAGAEQLLGNGDMLFSVNGGNNALRVQGCYVSDPEVQKVVSFVKNSGEERYDAEVWEEIERNAASAGKGKKKIFDDDEAPGDDPMLPSAIEVVVNAQMASTTMLQKKLKLGYARASRLVDLLEDRGIVGPPDGSRPRKVLLSPTQWQEALANGEFGG